jgi:hypothetical protein
MSGVTKGFLGNVKRLKVFKCPEDDNIGTAEI